MLKRAEGTAGQHDRDPRDGRFQRERGGQAVRDDDELAEICAIDERLGNGERGRADIHEHAGPAGDERDGPTGDGALHRGGPSGAVLDAGFAVIRKHRRRAAVHATDPTLRLERREVGAEGDLAHAESAAAVGDAQEAVLGDRRGDPLASRLGRRGIHGDIAFFMKSKASFRYRNCMSSAIARHATRLADGRDLIYFDDADTTLGPDRAIDPRVLEPRPETATMRQDALTGEWISIAAARQNRVVLPPADRDPLAPQTPGNPSEIPSRYDVAVFENRSPSFGPALGDDPAAPRGLADLDELGFERSRLAVGRCEVVCFSPETTGSFATQTPSRARTVIEAWADRTAALSALPGVQQVVPFENRGEAIGVTLHHPHGQIYAYPYITPRTQQTLTELERGGPELFGRILDSERAGRRVVIAGDRWTAFVPFAARVAAGGAHAAAPARSPTSRRRLTKSATNSPASSCASCAGSTPSTTPRRRTSPPGTRPRSIALGTPSGCTSS